MYRSLISLLTARKLDGTVIEHGVPHSRLQTGLHSVSCQLPIQGLQLPRRGPLFGHLKFDQTSQDSSHAFYWI